VMLSIIVGVAAGTRGHNAAWFLLALIISPLLAALCLIALPHRLSRDRPKAGALAAAALTADRIDYWIRRHVIQYWHEAHPSQQRLSFAQDKRIGPSAIGQCPKQQYDAFATPMSPASRCRQATRNTETGIEPLITILEVAASEPVAFA
jgi:hypothetical protein